MFKLRWGISLNSEDIFIRLLCQKVAIFKVTSGSKDYFVWDKCSLGGKDVQVQKPRSFVYFTENYIWRISKESVFSSWKYLKLIPSNRYNRLCLIFMNTSFSISYFCHIVNVYEYFTCKICRCLLQMQWLHAHAICLQVGLPRFLHVDIFHVWMYMKM